MTTFDLALAQALHDRYLIEGELGRGGMATVYLARDVRHARYVALKHLTPELVTAVGVERFQREIQVAASSLWRQADAVLRPLVGEAKEGVRRLASSAPSGS